MVRATLEGQSMVDLAIARFREFEPSEGFHLAFSGGVDSVATHNLAVEADVKFDAHYNVSPIDPQEVRLFIRDYYPDVAWDYHARGFWKQFNTEGPPMRIARWCCEVIKEAGGEGRRVVTGIRREESRNRRGRLVYEPCYTRAKTDFLHPILDWTRADVWEYIKKRNLPYCSLYDEGFSRLGCVLCPYHGEAQSRRELERFPKVARLWRIAMDRYFQTRIDRGTPLQWDTPEDFWQWWLSRGHSKAPDKAQSRMFD